MVVKQWDAHLLTKQHRTSVAREKAEQERSKAKRPAEEPLSTVGLGGAPATVAVTGLARTCAFGEFRMVVMTVGAPLRCVTP